MTLSIDERNAVVSYRIEKAIETIKEVEGIIPLGYWNSAANRLYYSAFYIVTALLIKNGYNAHTHAGVKNLFALHYVKTGIIDNEELRFYLKLFDFRLKGDYDDFFDLTEKDILPLIEPAKEFINKIEQLINAR